MFNPTNLDEVCVQVTHLESKGQSVNDVFSMKPIQVKEGKNKIKEKQKWTTIMKKEYEKPSCSYFKKEEYDEDKCWKLHLELRPKWIQDRKHKQMTVSIVQ